MQMHVRGPELKRHIAQTAAALFYKDGITNVGVDRIAAQSGVTKRTLYHHFGSKDAMIAAALRESPIVAFPKDGTPVERMLGAFAAMRQFLSDTRYRSCPYIIFTAELTDRNHPARRIVSQRVDKRIRWFADLAARAGARDPQQLAEQLDVLFDGALAAAAKRENLRAADAAIIAATQLMKLSGIAL